VFQYQVLFDMLQEDPRLLEITGGAGGHRWFCVLLTD
jgi:hypothetical protein